MAWYEDWFDSPYYHLLYKHRDHEEAEYFLTNLFEELQLPKSSIVLDLACGKGRHSLFMHRLGYKVLGVDLAQNSINQASEYTVSGLDFQVHDMRKPIQGQSFDAVFNLFTSFGYFDEESDNQKVFDSVTSMLRSRGVFVLDYLNPSFVEKHLTNAEVKEIEGIRFKITREIKNQFVTKNIEFTDQGRSYQFQEKVSLFHEEDFEDFASKSGMKVQAIYGDYSLAPFEDEDSERQIFVFEKL